MRRNKIPYVEMPAGLFEATRKRINRMSPEDFNEKFSQLTLERLGLDVKKSPDKFLFRFFYLEEDPEKRRERLEKISVYGSDRTDLELEPMGVYEEASRVSGIDQQYFFCCGMLPGFSEHYLEKYNALLIYDSDRIYIPRGRTEYTFKNVAKKEDALLAIVGMM